MTDHTHDARARSWLDDGRPSPGGFGVQVLPYGAFTTRGHDVPRLGVALGGHVLDLGAALHAGVFDDLDAAARPALRAVTLNALLALSPALWTAVRHRVFALLVEDAGGWRGARELVRECLVPMAATRMHLPVAVGDYTDFYASRPHATNVGTMLRPDQPLCPNYLHAPSGYHGRASSIVVSDTHITRPRGQCLPPGATHPVFGPSQRLDYELEVGLVIGGENALGESVPIGRALERVFGVVLLNDWSARDIQAWEHQPLGPFLGKSFATSISAWVVPLAALAPRRVAAAPRESGDPPILPYLFDADDQARGAIDLDLEVTLQTSCMRDLGLAPEHVSRSNMRELSWTPAQLVAHHTSNGCNLRPGDLLGTGTVSGPRPDSRGCLLERTWRGSEPLVLSSGESRRFLEDGDRVELRGLSGMVCVGEIGAARGAGDSSAA